MKKSPQRVRKVKEPKTLYVHYPFTTYPADEVIKVLMSEIRRVSKKYKVPTSRLSAFFQVKPIGQGHYFFSEVLQTNLPAKRRK
jgi:hypothetical protein